MSERRHATPQTPRPVDLVQLADRIDARLRAGGVLGSDCPPEELERALDQARGYLASAIGMLRQGASWGAAAEAGRVRDDALHYIADYSTDPQAARLARAARDGRALPRALAPPAEPTAADLPGPGSQARRVLEALDDLSEPDELYTYARVIARDTGLSPADARRALKLLRRRGLAAFRRGLLTEEGVVAGSGYAITLPGRQLRAANVDANAAGSQHRERTRHAV
jgi:DNA-binding transcriptional ArsR family regulator